MTLYMPFMLENTRPKTSFIAPLGGTVQLSWSPESLKQHFGFSSTIIISFPIRFPLKIPPKRYIKHILAPHKHIILAHWEMGNICFSGVNSHFSHQMALTVTVYSGSHLCKWLLPSEPQNQKLLTTTRTAGPSTTFWNWSGFHILWF